MNHLRQLIQSVRMPAMAASRRNMAYLGTIDTPSGTIRYGYTQIVDFAGTPYLVPYTCSTYIDEIDQILDHLIRDIPREDFDVSRDLMEQITNQRLTRRYNVYFNVVLYPSAKSMLPPCYKMV